MAYEEEILVQATDGIRRRNFNKRLLMAYEEENSKSDSNRQQIRQATEEENYSTQLAK